MLVRWGDFDRAFAGMDEVRRRMERFAEEHEGFARGPQVNGSQPRMNLWDRGAELVLEAEVPGMADKDLKLTLNQDVLTLEGQRGVEAPEGHSVHRRERPAVRFARSVALPVRVDPEKVNARVQDGMLTVTMTKAADAQPRQIQVKTH